MAEVIDINTWEEYVALTAIPDQKIVIFFWASWHEPSKQGGQLQEVFGALATKYADKLILFCGVEAENVPHVSEKLEVEVVPTFVAMIGSQVIDKVTGVDPKDVSKLVKNLNEHTGPPVTDSETVSELEKQKKLERLVNYAPVMLFMKGSSSEPKCGFSRQVVEMLTRHSIPFASFDILEDEEVRAGLKEYSDWPTYPQLYVKGVLQGGLDILKEMEADPSGGTLKEQLGVSDVQPATITEVSLADRLKALINQAPVMAFIKGDPEQPRCGFSKTLCALLREEGVEFGSFDILGDEEVRQGLKTFSDWPTYPQVYVRGEFMGGLDILQEMAEGGPLKEQFEI